MAEPRYRYGGDSAIGALLLPERREILRDEQNQFIGYDDQGNAIVQTLPAQYGESEVDFSYSPIVRGVKATGSFLNDIFFGDANEQAEAAGRTVSAVRGVVGGLVDYAVDQYQAGMAGGTTYDPETRQITEFDPTQVLLSNAPAGIQAVRNAPPNTMTLGAAGGRMNPTRNIDTEVSEAKAAYDLDPNNEELRQSYMALRRERDSVPSLPRIRRGRGSAIRVFHGSPYEFENFSMGNIGTGEGAQAYGYGLYFAESPEIARSYRDQLSQSGGSIGGRPIMDDYNSIIERADRLPPAAAQIEYDKAAFLEDLELTDDIAESISRIENPEVAKWARSEVAPQFKPAGYSYEANLNVTIDDLLDYDELLSDQPDAILNKLRNTDWFEFAEESLDLDLADNPTGGDLLKWLSQDYNPQEVSQILSGIGIKGTKYFDANSRNRGNNQERTSNYVIFDDSLIDTKRVNDKLTPSWMDQGARMQRAQDQGYEPIYHGSTYDIEQIDLSGMSPESHFGRGFYSTTSPRDASENYARTFGPDLKNKINRRAEQIEDELDLTDEMAVNSGYADVAEMSFDMAKKEVQGPNEGVVYPLMGRTTNAFDISNDGNTFLRYEQPEINPEDYLDEAGGDMDVAYDLAQEAAYDFEPEGELVDFLESLRRNPYLSQDDFATLQSSILEEAYDGGISANRLDEIFRSADIYPEDDAGNLISHDILRQAIQDSGYDTIIHNADIFKSMDVDTGTKHKIFLDPTRVRSINAEFDPAKMDSADLLSSVGATSALRGIV